MKKIFLVAIMIMVSVLIVGCGNDRSSEVDDSGAIPDRASSDSQDGVIISERTDDTRSDPAEENRVEPALEEDQETLSPPVQETSSEDEQSARNLPDKVAEVVDRATANPQYSYFFDSNEYIVNKEKIRIILGSNVGSAQEGNLYNEVLIDRETNTAYAWCSDRLLCGKDEHKVFWEVDFRQYDAVTPLDRLKNLDNAEFVAESRCESRECMQIRFRDNDGIDKTMWIFTRNPIVWKVEWFDERQGKSFTDLYQRIAFKNTNDLVKTPEGYIFSNK